MKPVNHHIRLAPRPSGLPKAPHLSSLPSRPPRPARAQIVPAVGYPSIDPATRRWISPNPADNGSVPIGTVIEAGATGQVIASEHPASRSGSTSAAHSAYKSWPAPTVRA